MLFAPISIPPPHVDTTSLFTLIDYSGVGVGALGGALAARRDTKFHFDYVGVLGLGLMSGVGGGIARDILLQHGPPLSLQNPRYLYIALTGALIALGFGSNFEGNTTGARFRRRAMMAIDALALGFFAIAGTTRAQSFGLGLLPCLLLGVMTAVGGGSLRDVFSGRTPTVFESGEPYAIAAATASLLFLFMLQIGIAASVATPVGIAVCFAMRMLGVQFKWRTQAVRPQ